ncbi:hypothetical protein EDC63_101749 [Sulfurirhabdus autotrophica]|uniref:Uncharacterized protein n=1 Tax=Sulfurirhabdus autotrophica TaxID=1706046 RepID=A0A4R3YE26_9PROT|nr:hypothetical protein EDC63_101749 [Sulfurirhabdus autotrophica]
MLFMISTSKYRPRSIQRNPKSNLIVKKAAYPELKGVRLFYNIAKRSVKILKHTNQYITLCKRIYHSIPPGFYRSWCRTLHDQCVAKTFSTYIVLLSTLAFLT